jgi:hypothetical protein
MKKIPSLLFTILVMAIIPGCASMNEMMGYSVNKGNGYAIKHNRQIYDGGVYIEYRDKAFLETEKRKEMSNKMAPESETKAALDRIPKGGRIIVTYESLTLEGANTKWLEYIVIQNGKEILRRKGKDDIAEVPRASGMWWNVDVVDIKDPIAMPFEFIVVSNLVTKRDTFVISGPQRQ